jgi:hypothetical protein
MSGPNPPARGGSPGPVAWAWPDVGGSNLDFWAGRRPTWVAVGAIAFIVGLSALLTFLRHGADLLAVVSIVVQALAVIPALVGLRRGPSLPKMSQELAQNVEKELRAALCHALADVGEPVPADISVAVPAAHLEPELVRWRDDGDGSCGHPQDMVAHLRSLPHGRLVIIGRPGGGKTVLATRLALDLISEHHSGAVERCPVPVLLNLPSWDIDNRCLTTGADREALARSFERWLTKRVADLGGFGWPDAKRLVEAGWVLPILDGLDELDRLRTEAVIRALNCRLMPVVLLCRDTYHSGLVAEGLGAAGTAPVLQDARRVIVQPIEPQYVRAYLQRRFRAAATGRIEPRWEPVYQALDHGAGFDAGLAETLSNPFLLSAAICAYHEAGTQPVDLLAMTTDQRRMHLLAMLIPTAARLVPARNGIDAPRTYRPESAVRWLARLARHLERAHNEHGWEPAEFRLDTLWPIAGWWVPRYVAVVVSTGLVLGSGGLLLASVAPGLTVRGVGCLAALLITGLGFVVRTQLATRWRPLKQFNGQRIRSVRGSLALAGTVVGCVAIAAAAEPLLRAAMTLDVPTILDRTAVQLLDPSLAGRFWARFADVFDLPARLAVGLATGLTVGMEAATATVTSIDRPGALLRRGLAYELVAATLSGIASGLVVGFGLELMDAVTDRPDATSADLVRGFCLGFGFSLLLAVSGSRWLRYALAIAIGRIRGGWLPSRPARFLDWAYRANLLRISGTATEFRHDELKKWLQSHG